MTSTCTPFVQSITNGHFFMNDNELRSPQNLAFTSRYSARFLSHKTDTSAFTTFQSTKSNYLDHYNFHYHNALKCLLINQSILDNGMWNSIQVDNLILQKQILSANKNTTSPISSSSTTSSKSGLDILRSLASIECKIPHHKNLEQKKQKQKQQRIPPNTTVQYCDEQNSKNKRTSKDGQCNRLTFIDKVRDSDILCGRGGLSNHHSGNRRYRQVVNEMSITYKNTEQKLKKTNLSGNIVDFVYKYGGRFIKKDTSTGKYYLLTKVEARRKTSQALRQSLLDQKKIK